MSVPKIEWGWGTAYDLFMSLVVLHKPDEFGIRGAWAAGVRARLSAQDRETLEKSHLLWTVPFHWLYTLPEPRNAAAVLWALGQLPASERMLVLADAHDSSREGVELLRAVAERQAWTESDLQAFQATYKDSHKHSEYSEEPSVKKLSTILDLWAGAEEYGEHYLQALRSYQEVFFAEEERRIRPALQDALERAQELAGQHTLLDLLEELTQGVRLDAPPEGDTLLLVPSYWSTPLVLMGMVDKGHPAWLFGARPADASLVPGEVVPETLLRTLKALSVPTRLRILRDLCQESLTPAQIARRLRLRAPTVTHHLKILRLAGLVQLSVGDQKQPRSYAARQEAVSAACDSLKSFLGPDRDEN